MNDFQDIYKSTMNHAAGFVPDASAILDGARRRRTAVRYGRKRFSSLAVTCGLLVICGVGVMTAGGYFPTGAGVQGNAAVTEGEAAEERMAVGNAADAAGENGLQASPQAAVSIGGQAAEEGTGQAAEEKERAAEEDTGQSAGDVSVRAFGGIVPGTDAPPGAAVTESRTDSQVQRAEIEKADGGREYDSLAAFEAAESMVLVVPKDPQQESGQIRIQVSEQADEILFQQWMEDGKLLQVYTAFHPAGKELMPDPAESGSILREWEYTTAAGYTYTLQSAEEQAQPGGKIHAVAETEGYYVAADFSGYTEEQACEMIEEMDPGIYED